MVWYGQAVARPGMARHGYDPAQANRLTGIEARGIINVVTHPCYTVVKPAWSRTLAQIGKDNPNWRGGRVRASNGYILIRVGLGHHLADIRGYAYEHRIIAEELLGRPLEPGEQVHHINGDKADNRPGNIEVKVSKAWHAVAHRKGEGRRLPDEENPLIPCACGCGQQITRYDKWGRPRKYVSGHNPIPAETQVEVLRALENGALHRKHIACIIGKPISSTSQALNELRTKNLIRQIGKGVWELVK